MIQNKTEIKTIYPKNYKRQFTETKLLPFCHLAVRKYDGANIIQWWLPSA